MIKSVSSCIKLKQVAAIMALASIPLYGQGADQQSPEALVQEYCVNCHNFEDYSGGVAFDLMDMNHVAKDQAVWEEAVNKLRGRLMPPAGQPQPKQEDVNRMVSFLETSIDDSAAEKRIGHVPVQRLNRTEFATIVSDLLGVTVNPEDILPSEIEVEGFENIANALGLHPLFWNSTSPPPVM